MLSPVIKELLETKLGKEIRYASDVEHLSFDIERNVGQRIGINTLKRLLGFIEDDTKEARLYTLDIVSKYLEFKNWDELLISLDKSGNSDFNTIEEINIKNLIIGNRIKFTYSPNREVCIEFLGNKSFKVVESINSKLQTNDTIEVNHFVLNYPLLVDNVCRNQEHLGKFVAGKISGITSLQLI